MTRRNAVSTSLLQLYRRNRATLRISHNFSKLSKVVFSGLLIGAFDAFQAKYLHIGSFGEGPAILYQIALMTVSMLFVVYFLYDKKWSKYRNVLSIMITIPVATLADNISLDLQTMKPYIILLPQNAFLWRSHLFSHAFLAPLANWIDAQTFASGLIDGYLVAFVICTAYISIQFLWSKRIQPKDSILEVRKLS